MEKLTREFYERDAECVAHDLIGKILVHDSNEGRTSGIITETEAYKGPEDKAGLQGLRQCTSLGATHIST